LCEDGGFCDVFHVLSCKFDYRTGGMKINVNVNVKAVEFTSLSQVTNDIMKAAGKVCIFWM
jgi:hypothetical protein